MQHLVYGSAGIGRKGTGVPSWETKLLIEDHMKALGLPLTILRPMAFMELMTDKKFFPAVATWHVMPRLMGHRGGFPGSARTILAPLPQKHLPTRTFIGKDLTLASDVQSLASAARCIAR